MLVLGIETSCDDTAVALFDSQTGGLTHQISTQSLLHNAYGGVVPELAARDHVKQLLPLIEQTIADSGRQTAEIEGVAYTNGPGLIGALMVGACLGKALAYAWGKPAIGLHHMESHLLVVGLLKEAPRFPFLALLISGGHTMLVHVHQMGRYKILGQTLDDAVGEAFDKVAKLLGLPYPGGPALGHLAKLGSPRFHFPRPMVDQPNCHFSFSGLKTHALHTLQKYGNSPATLADIAYAFQVAVVDTLLSKCLYALSQTKLETLVLVGGVASNEMLRQRVSEVVSKQGVRVFYPPKEWCTDNAVMVAYNGYLHFQAGEKDLKLNIEVKPRWSMEELS